MSKIRIGVISTDLKRAQSAAAAFATSSQTEVLAHKVQDLDDAHKLAGMTFEALLVLDYPPQDAYDYLRSRVRSLVR